MLLTGSRDKAIKLWDIHSDPEGIFQENVMQNAHNDWVNSLCAHNNVLYSAGREGRVFFVLTVRYMDIDLQIFDLDTNIYKWNDIIIMNYHDN